MHALLECQHALSLALRQQMWQEYQAADTEMEEFIKSSPPKVAIRVMTGLQLLNSPEANASLLKVAVLTLSKIYTETGCAPRGHVQDNIMKLRERAILSLTTHTCSMCKGTFRSHFQHDLNDCAHPLRQNCRAHLWNRIEKHNLDLFAFLKTLIHKSHGRTHTN